jgi:hypothetical protein
MLEELEKRKAAMERCTRSGCYTFFLDVSGGGKTTTSECSLLLLRGGMRRQTHLACIGGSNVLVQLNGSCFAHRRDICEHKRVIMHSSWNSIRPLGNYQLTLYELWAEQVKEVGQANTTLSHFVVGIAHLLLLMMTGKRELAHGIRIRHSRLINGLLLSGHLSSRQVSGIDHSRMT